MDSELFEELEGNLKAAVGYTAQEKLEHEVQMLRKELERLTNHVTVGDVRLDLGFTQEEIDSWDEEQE